jgi:peptidoglycan/xylan/chitin deacetylase (PgdA/CDA1 family)
VSALSPKKYKHHYKRWREDVLLASPFVIFCGIIACIFLFYRFALVVAPLALLQPTASPHTSVGGLVCSEEEGSPPADPTPILSASYQKRVQEQVALSSNLVTNAELTATNTNNLQPVGYTRTTKTLGVQYNRKRDATNGPLYLRTLATKNTPDSSVPPAWLMQPVAVVPGRSYAYSFLYRSDVPVAVSTETSSGGKVAYRDATTLNPSSSWQQFTAHFSNTTDAATFRMDISSRTKGFVDTRGFTVHEIASAELQKGIVSVAFDDGWQSIDDKAIPLLDKYHIRTTQYIISDVAGHDVPGYMNYATIQKLRKDGHEIGSHTLNHCDQTLLDTPAITRDATKSKQMLEDKKLGPIKSFAYPLGQYDQKTETVYEKTYPLVRSSDFGYNDRYFDETNIHSIGILNTTSDKEFRSWLDYAKKHKVWVVLVYHKVDSVPETYSVTSAQLDRQLQMIKNSGLDNKPISAVAEAIRP